MTPQPATPLTPRTLRALTEGDIAALQVIDDAAHGQAWSQRTFTDEVERSDRLHLVAETDSGIVGHASAWIDGSSCRITNVAVASDHHGCGHATALLLALIHQALTATKVANLQLEVRPANRRAQRMYGRFGFVPVGIERNFYDRSDDQGSKDAVIMAVADVCTDVWRERLSALQDEHDLSTNNTDAGAAA